MDCSIYDTEILRDNLNPACRKWLTPAPRSRTQPAQVLVFSAALGVGSARITIKKQRQAQSTLRKIGRRRFAQFHATATVHRRCRRDEPSERFRKSLKLLRQLDRRLRIAVFSRSFQPRMRPISSPL